MKHKVDLLDVEVRPSLAEGESPLSSRTPATTPPSSSSSVSIPSAAAAERHLRPRRRQPRASPHLQPQALRDPEPMPQRQPVAVPHGAGSSASVASSAELVPEGQKGPQRLHRQRRRARARGPSSQRHCLAGVPAAAHGKQAVVAHPGEDPQSSPGGVTGRERRDASAAAAQQRRQRQALVVAERPRRRVEPERAPQDRVFDGTADLEVPDRANVVCLELDLQREEVDGLDEAEAVGEVGGVGDAVLSFVLLSFFFFFPGMSFFEFFFFFRERRARGRVFESVSLFLSFSLSVSLLPSAPKKTTLLPTYERSGRSMTCGGEERGRQREGLETAG